MRTLFEWESEVGKCPFEPSEPDGFRYADPDYAILFAHTKAYLNGTKGMLKIEQHCYLRHGPDLPDQPWFKPEIILEPVRGSMDEMSELALTLHHQFVERIRNRFPQEYPA